MSIHTPGPWEVSHAGVGGQNGFRVTEYYVRIPGADFALAADIIDADMKPSEANARLMAAAPEMLFSLIELKQLLDIACSIGAVPSPAANGPAARALAAIRKATGG